MLNFAQLPYPSTAIMLDDIERYDPLFVLASYVIASVAAYVAIFILKQIPRYPVRDRVGGIILGALVMGTGLWSMHYTGMLSYDMTMVHNYDLWLTLGSGLIAFLFSCAVFYLLTLPSFRLGHILISAPLLGVTIATMHYTGMAAMQVKADIAYRPGLFALSILIAVAASGAALGIMHFVTRLTGRQHTTHVAAALVLGLGVCGMHYTGMAATVFTPFADCRFQEGQSHIRLAAYIVALSFGVILIGFIAGMRYSMRSENLQETSALRWQSVYFFLAAFSILSVGLNQYLGHLHEHINLSSKRMTIAVQDLQEQIQALSRATRDANAPPNNVFASLDPVAEKEAFEAADSQLAREIGAVRAQLGDFRSRISSEHPGLVLENVEKNIGMLAELKATNTRLTESLFTTFALNDRNHAAALMAQIDNNASSQIDLVTQSISALGSFSREYLELHSVRADGIRQLNTMISFATIAMILTAVIYGRKLAAQVRMDAQYRMKQQRFMQIIIDAIADPIFVKDAGHHWRAGNAAFWKMMGGAPEKFIGKNDKDFFPPEEVKVFWEKDDLVVRHQVVDINDEYISQADGRTIFASTKKAPIVFPDGSPGLVGVIRDITDLKQKEYALNQHRQHLQEMVDEQTATISLLRNVALFANQSRDPNLALLSCMKLMCDFIAWPVAHAFIYDPERNVLKPGDFCYISQTDNYREFTRLSYETVIPQGKGLPGRVLTDKCAHWIKDIPKDDNFLRQEAAAACGLRCGAAFPVMIDDQVFAVIEFFNTVSMPPVPEILAIMEEIGKQVGTVFEREQRQEKLSAAKADAERANLAKSEFLANMSHELRTPMHAILGFSRQAAKRLAGSGNDKIITMLANIQTSGNRLLVLLNELLDLSKLEAGATSFTPEAQDISKALDQTLTELQSLLHAKNITPVIEKKTPNTILPYDYKLMVQVFVNLLSNAIKFSPDNSEITIRLMEIDSHDDPEFGREGLLCEVLDRGVGIPHKELMLIFDKFAQSSKTKTGAGGTGLGLSIVREIVEMHRGRIYAVNNPGGGACFRILLPYDSNRHPPIAEG